MGVAHFAQEDRSKEQREVRDRGKEMDALVERLKVRFGPEHEIAAAFSAADEEVLGVLRKVELIRFQGATEYDDPYAQRQTREFYDKKTLEIEGLREVFDSRREDFVAAAYRAAGAKLPSN